MKTDKDLPPSTRGCSQIVSCHDKNNINKIDKSVEISQLSYILVSHLFDLVGIVQLK